MERSGVRPSVGRSVCPISRPQQRRAAGLLLSAQLTGDGEPGSNGAAARR